jgi:putative restriction endonuclease
MALPTVDPDWEIRAAAFQTLDWLSRTLLETRDGPTLEHAVKAFHGQHLHLPRQREDQPGQRFLEERYERFRQVG